MIDKSCSESCSWQHTRKSSKSKVAAIILNNCTLCLYNKLVSTNQFSWIRVQVNVFRMTSYYYLPYLLFNNIVTLLNCVSTRNKYWKLINNKAFSNIFRTPLKDSNTSYIVTFTVFPQRGREIINLESRYILLWPQEALYLPRTS